MRHDGIRLIVSTQSPTIQHHRTRKLFDVNIVNLSVTPHVTRYLSRYLYFYLYPTLPYLNLTSTPTPTSSSRAAGVGDGQRTPSISQQRLACLSGEEIAVVQGIMGPPFVSESWPSIGLRLKTTSLPPGNGVGRPSTGGNPICIFFRYSPVSRDVHLWTQLSCHSNSTALHCRPWRECS